MTAGATDSATINPDCRFSSGFALLRGDAGQLIGRPSLAPDIGDTEETKPRHLLCRTCLRKITRDDARVEIEGRHVHVFCNPYGLVFEIGCFAEAPGCTTLGLPTAEFTWFAGHEWQIALCRGCRAHLGWRYTGLHGGGFFGLILTNLVGE